MKRIEGTILVVDDDQSIITSARLLLDQFFSKVLTSCNPEDIVELLANHQVDVLVLDMNFSPGQMAGDEGIYWLEKALKLSPDTVVIMITAFADIDLAVKAVRIGATDFVVKPWNNEKFITTIHAGLKAGQTSRTLKTVQERQQAFQQYHSKELPPIVGTSAEMNGLREMMNRVSQTDADVLLLGENGTGKGLVAEHLHAASLRRNAAFVQVDIGALPSTLFESELFGHEKGAFTDAKSSQIGKFELANGGTLFLDEIGNIPIELQSKILSVLQNRRVRKIGGNKEISLDVRVITATNQPLYQMVEDGRFRRDLFYRINLIEILIPPLRERPGDLPALVSHFLEIYSRKYNKQISGISVGAEKMLQQYPWPGNIRELQHTVERAVILSNRKQLAEDDFLINQNRVRPMPDQTDLNLNNIEKQVMLAALLKNNGVISLAAKEVGISRSSFYRYMKKYEI